MNAIEVRCHAVGGGLTDLEKHTSESKTNFFRLYLAFPLDGISLTLPPLRPSGTGRHAASVAPFVGPDGSFAPLWWTFAALRCRDLAGSSLAMSF